MAIKDRDGNVYKLRGPNPLVKDMSDWNKDAVKLINHFGSKEEVVVDATSSEAIARDNTVNISDELNLYEGTERSKVIPPRDFIEEAAKPIEQAVVNEPISA